MYTLWLAPTDWVTGDPSLKIDYPSLGHPATLVTCMGRPSDLKWVSMSLRLPAGVRIEEVELCYQTSDPRSFISQVRLAQMGTPERAVVLHDDGTDLTSTTPARHRSIVGGIVPSQGEAVTLMLRLKFAHHSHRIMLGAVGVSLTGVPHPGFSSCPPGALDIRAFGARGDGTTDDTRAIQAALDAAGGSGGGVVHVPPGTWSVSSTLLVPSRIELRGAGIGVSILRLADGASEAAGVSTDVVRNALSERGDSHIVLSGLEIDGNRSNNPRNIGGWNDYGAYGSDDQNGIHWKNVRESRIENCLVHDCARCGILMSGCRDDAVIGTRSEDNGNITITSGGFYQFEGFGILLWEGNVVGGGNRAVRMRGCTVRGNEKHGIELLGASNEDVLIEGCVASNNNSLGIVVNGASLHPGIITSCTCEDNAEGGIGIFGARHAIVTGNLLRRNAHGRFRGFSGEPDAITGAALSILDAQGGLFAHNTIFDTLRSVKTDPMAISCDGDDNRIVGNHIERVARQGILFNGTGNLILGNTVLEAGLEGAVAIQANGARLCTIADNRVRGAPQVGIYCAGPRDDSGALRISGNVVEECGASGISLIEQNDCVIEGNTCLGNGAITPGEAGITLHTSARTVVMGNRCGNAPGGSSQAYGIRMVCATGNEGLLGEAVITGNVLVGNAVAPALVDGLSGAGNQFGLNIPALP